MKLNEMIELDEEQLEQVEGGSLVVCSFFGAGNAMAVGFALAAAGIPTAGWGALAGAIALGSCLLGQEGTLGQISDVYAP